MKENGAKYIEVKKSMNLKNVRPEKCHKPESSKCLLMLEDNGNDNEIDNVDNQPSNDKNLSNVEV